jgi:hypothetical protein
MIRTFGRCGSLDRMNTLPRATVNTDWHLGTVSIELSANPYAVRVTATGVLKWGLATHSAEV